MQTKDREGIMHVARQATAAWVGGRLQDLENFFHEDMVIVAPGFGERVEGRQACVDGYRDFCSKARILDFKEADHQIDVFGSTAVVTYHFEMTYEWNGEALRDSGRDALVFVWEGDKWLAVWRTIIPD